MMTKEQAREVQKAIHQKKEVGILRRPDEVRYAAAELVLKTDSPRAKVNKLYAMAKRYDRQGGADLLDALEVEAGCLPLNFSILYDALKLLGV